MGGKRKLDSPVQATGSPARTQDTSAQNAPNGRAPWRINLRANMGATGDSRPTVAHLARTASRALRWARVLSTQATRRSIQARTRLRLVALAVVVCPRAAFAQVAEPPAPPVAASAPVADHQRRSLRQRGRRADPHASPPIAPGASPPAVPASVSPCPSRPASPVDRVCRGQCGTQHAGHRVGRRAGRSHGPRQEAERRSARRAGSPGARYALGAGHVRRSLPGHRGAPRHRADGQRLALLLRARRAAGRHGLLRRWRSRPHAISHRARRVDRASGARRPRRLLSGGGAGSLRSIRRRNHRRANDGPEPRGARRGERAPVRCERVRREPPWRIDERGRGRPLRLPEPAPVDFRADALAPLRRLHLSPDAFAHEVRPDLGLRLRRLRSRRRLDPEPGSHRLAVSSRRPSLRSRVGDRLAPCRHDVRVRSHHGQRPLEGCRDGRIDEHSASRRAGSALRQRRRALRGRGRQCGPLWLHIPGDRDRDVSRWQRGNRRGIRRPDDPSGAGARPGPRRPRGRIPSVVGALREPRRSRSTRSWPRA